MYTAIADLLRQTNIPLKSTQNKICVPIVERIYKKMKAGINFSAIRTDNDVIIEGHHRYVASLLSGFFLDKFPSQKTTATEVVDWAHVALVEEDWDTAAKVLKLNEDDAKFNNISLAELNALLK